jgi:hypothetical protein
MRKTEVTGDKHRPVKIDFADRSAWRYAQGLPDWFGEVFGAPGLKAVSQKDHFGYLAHGSSTESVLSHGIEDVGIGDFEFSLE